MDTTWSKVDVATFDAENKNITEHKRVTERWKDLNIKTNVLRW